jgi:hypothetical protein
MGLTKSRSQRDPIKGHGTSHGAGRTPLARAGTEGLLRPLRPDGDAGETDGILGESAGRCQGWYFPLRVACANPRTLQQGPADHTNPEVLSLPAPSLLCIALTCSPRSTPSSYSRPPGLRATRPWSSAEEGPGPSTSTPPCRTNSRIWE